MEIINKREKSFHKTRYFFVFFFFDRLLFLETGRKDCHTVVKIKDIKTVEASNYSGAVLAFARGVTAIEITSKSKMTTQTKVNYFYKYLGFLI